MRIIAFLFILLMIPSALAETSFCYNSTHRQIDKIINITIGETTYDVHSSELEYCPYGCNADTGICSQPSYMQVVIVIALFFIAVIAYLIIRVR
jgi:hypothetical protein